MPNYFWDKLVRPILLLLRRLFSISSLPPHERVKGVSSLSVPDGGWSATFNNTEITNWSPGPTRNRARKVKEVAKNLFAKQIHVKTKFTLKHQATIQWMQWHMIYHDISRLVFIFQNTNTFWKGNIPNMKLGSVLCFHVFAQVRFAGGLVVT